MNKKTKTKLTAIIVLAFDKDGERQEVFRMSPKDMKNLIMLKAGGNCMLSMARQGGGFFELRAEIGTK